MAALFRTVGPGVEQALTVGELESRLAQGTLEASVLTLDQALVGLPVCTVGPWNCQAGVAWHAGSGFGGVGLGRCPACSEGASDQRSGSRTKPGACSRSARCQPAWVCRGVAQMNSRLPCQSVGYRRVTGVEYCELNRGVETYGTGERSENGIGEELIGSTRRIPDLRKCKIAILTNRITYLTEHFKLHKKTTTRGVDC